MDLLKTILLYLTMVFVSSVQSAPDASLMPQPSTPAPTAIAATASVTPAPTPTPTPVPTPNITPNSVYKTIKVGDKGDDVKKLQRRLAELGYYTGEVDGVFGNQTRRSVERFQYYQGLSVDGIAGKRTQTVLYESKEVVFAPVDVTPTPTAKVAVGPTAAITTPPVTSTPAPTFVPAPTATATSTPNVAAQSTATVAPAVEELIAASDGSVLTDANASIAPEGSVTPEATGETQAPQVLANQDFILTGGTEPLALATADAAATSTPAPLHPAQYGDQVYVPLLEIVRSAGSVIIPGTATAETQEVAFSLLSDVYQITYNIDNGGNITNLQVLKNQSPQVMSLRNAFLLDGVFYLPLTVTTELTGITFTLDEAATRYTITLPTLPEA